MSADALATARDALDEFLLGYAEGKNEEVRAYVEEQMEKEKEFAERVRRIRSEIEQQQQQQRAAAQQVPSAPPPAQGPSTPA